MRTTIIAFTLLATFAGTSAGQSASAEITAGDREYRAMRAVAALAHYARALAPERIVHHLELADVYRDRGNRVAARSSYETVLRLPVADYNDERYKAQAEAALRLLP